MLRVSASESIQKIEVGLHLTPIRAGIDIVNKKMLQVNRGEESFELDDPRWCDVHVVSSLLKSFFRKLPDPLFTLVSPFNTPSTVVERGLKLIRSRARISQGLWLFLFLSTH